MKSAEIKLLSERDHILQRPNMYVGNTNTIEKENWIIKDNKLIYEKYYYNAAYFKLIHEILDNSIDEFIKTQGKFAKKINIKIENDFTITIKDNGRGVPTEPLKIGQKPQAYIAFTNLRAGSNFKSDRDSIGQNGVGASLTNVFSDFFNVITNDDKKCFKMACNDNMSSIKYELSKKGKRGTEVKFKLSRRHFDDIDKITIENIKNDILKRILEVRMMYNISFKLNGKKIQETLFDYLPKNNGKYSDKNCDLTLYNKEDAKNLSYVNSLNTYGGGTHTSYISSKITNILRENIKKKFKIELKPSQIEKYYCYVLSLKIKDPEFDNQNKTKLINKNACQSFVIDKIIKMINKSFKDNIAYWETVADQFKIKDENKKLKDLEKKRKKINKNSIENYIDINGKKYDNAILCVFEGLSAISNLLKVRDPKIHAGYSLKGKIANVYEMTNSEVLKNKVISEIMTICGLKFGDSSKFKFKELAICTDSDLDGDHIFVMIINFFVKYFPELIEQGKITRYLSPLIVIEKGKKRKLFYSLSEWKKHENKYLDWKFGYLKGLGSLDDKDYNEMINKPKKIIVTINDDYEEIVDMAFNKKRSDDRKIWLQGD